MHSSTPLYASILLAAIGVIGFVGINATTEGDPQPTLMLMMTGLLAPLIAVVVQMLQKQLKTSEEVARKVDQLLNGSLQSRIDSLDTSVSDLNSRVSDVAARVSNIEKSIIQILTKLS